MQKLCYYNQWHKRAVIKAECFMEETFINIAMISEHKKLFEETEILLLL